MSNIEHDRYAYNYVYNIAQTAEISVILKKESVTICLYTSTRLYAIL